MSGIEVYIGIILVSLLGVSAYTLQMLTLTGFIAAIPIGLITLFGGGPEWFAVLLYFLIVGSLLTKIRYKFKKLRDKDEGKIGRTWVNVLSNGVIPATLCFLNIHFINVSIKQLLYVFYVGAVASMLADTASTEIGLLYPKYPRLITKPRIRVPPGTSGGVTPLGFISGLLAAFSISIVALPGANLLYMNPSRLLFTIVIAGFLGSLIDSILGATVQGIYICRKCGLIVEEHKHCGSSAKLYGGIKYIDNNIVNIISSFLGGLFALSIYIIYI